MAGRGTDIKLDDEAKAAGGLKIIGTERHESRRIDNQLRGRAGRQGDPGESRFYISLEDDLMRLFGSERLMDVFNEMCIRDRISSVSALTNAKKLCPRSSIWIHASSGYMGLISNFLVRMIFTS